MRTNKYYIDPIELHNEIVSAKSNNKVSEKLGIMFLDLVNGIFKRPNFCGYRDEIKDEMLFRAIHNLIKYVPNRYNPIYFTTNKTSAYSFCTSCVFLAFTTAIRTIKHKQNKEQTIIEEMFFE